MRRALLAASLLAACAPAPPPPADLPAGGPAPLPPGFEILGGPCPQAPGPSFDAQYACNADRIVARVYTLAQGSTPVFNGAARLHPMPPGTASVEGAYGTPVRVFLDGERLWFAAGCVPCRVPSEELWIVELPLAGDADLARLQALLGLPGSPALRTARAWREVIAERRAER